MAENKTPAGSYLIELCYANLILQYAEKGFAEEPSATPPKDHVEGDEGSPKKTSFFKKLLATPTRKAGLALLIVVLPSVFLLLFSNLYYKNKLLPNTYFAGQKLSTNLQEAEQSVQTRIADFKLKFNYKQEGKDFTQQEVGVSFNKDQLLDEVKSSTSSVGFFKKPFALFAKKEVSPSLDVNEDALKNFLASQNYGDKIPEDAKIDFSNEAKEYVIIPEVSGRGIDIKELTEELKSKGRALSHQEIALNITDVKPTLTSDNLQTSLARINSLVKQSITVSTPERNFSSTTLDAKNWLILKPDPASLQYQVEFHQKAFNSYIDSVVAKINRKMEKRLYADISGSQTLIQGGLAGRTVNNANQIKTELFTAMKSSKGGSVNAGLTEEAVVTENIAVTGGRWVFADISQFKVYAYEGANLINSFSMSSGAPETPTPPGSYQVMSKVRIKTMRGGTPGTRDYYSVPNIEWVAYFKSGGYAMHGVYWHNNFGVKNTSHGCMGMRNADAKWIYDFVDIGTPVVVVP